MTTRAMIGTPDDEEAPAPEYPEEIEKNEAVLAPVRGVSISEPSERVFQGKLIQWSTDGTIFVPCGKTTPLLSPGVYEINRTPTIGIFFEKVPVKLEELLRFPDATSDTVISEIRLFWKKADLFKIYKIPFKRGVLLYGPPGSGKSSTVQFIMSDVVQMGGVVFVFDSVANFTDGMRQFRQIQPETPVVVIMEDIDSILANTKTSAILNILDGVNQIERTVFLATTNYPERLEKRISNRPSRFDKRFKIGFPSPAARKIYLESLFNRNPANDDAEIDTWVEATEGFSISHLKELFTAVKILGNKYEDALRNLTEMNETFLDSEKDDERKRLGFKRA